MKKTITILTAITLMIACNSGKETKQTALTQGIYFSVFKKDGKVTDGVCRIFIQDSIAEVNGKRVIADSKLIYAVLGNLPTKTKEGKDTTVMAWSEIKKDSVKIINPLTVDSLFKTFK